MTIHYTLPPGTVHQRTHDHIRPDEAVNTLLDGAHRHLLNGDAIAALHLLNRPLTEPWAEARHGFGPTACVCSAARIRCGWRCIVIRARRTRGPSRAAMQVTPC